MKIHHEDRDAAADNSGMLDVLTKVVSLFGVRLVVDSCGFIGGEVGFPPCRTPHLESARESLVVRQDLLELDLPAPDMLAPARHRSIAATTTTTGGKASRTYVTALTRDRQYHRHSSTERSSGYYGVEER